MNTAEYISSGILEAYVTGAATAEERADVEAMAAKHPEVKAELEAIEDAINAYASKHAVEPPAHLRDKILNEIAATPRATSNGGDTKVFRMEPPAPVVTTTQPRSYSVLAIAASVALLISIPLNIYLYSKASSTESKLAVMTNMEQHMETAMNDSLLAVQSMRTELYVLKDPMFKMVSLKGLKAAPDAKAMVCWCPDSKEVYFEPEKLPAVPKGMQYELWAIVDGKPVDAGMIKMDSGMQKMKLVSGATAFAVTLEKEGGSDTPHGDMYVMGNISI